MDNGKVIEIIFANLLIFALSYTRIFVTLYTVSVLRQEMASLRLMICFAGVLAFYVILLTPATAPTATTLSFDLLIKMIVQVLIGFMGGFLLNIVFEVFVSAGQIVSSQIGLAAASLFDPRFGMITSLTHFYLILAIIIFFQLNGHLILIDSLIKSFHVIPLDATINHLQFGDLVRFAAVIFKSGLLIAISIVAVILMTNICLAIMSKFAPQFNLFSIGLNMSLVIGLVLVYATFHITCDKGTEFIQDGLRHLQEFYYIGSTHEPR